MRNVYGAVVEVAAATSERPARRNGLATTSNTRHLQVKACTASESGDGGYFAFEYRAILLQEGGSGPGRLGDWLFQVQPQLATARLGCLRLEGETPSYEEKCHGHRSRDFTGRERSDPRQS